MAKAAQKPDETPDVKPDETPDETPPKDPPKEPDKDKAKDLVKPDENDRKSMWTDLAAKLERRIKSLEDSQVAGTMWTLPAILACAAVGVALLVSFGAIYIAIKGWPKFGGEA